MSYSAILLESGSLDYLLREDDEILLLEDHLFDANYGRLPSIDDYNLLLEDDSSLLDELESPLSLEYIVYNIPFMPMVLCYTETEFITPTGVGAFTLANLTLVSSGMLETNYGYLDISIGNMSYFVIDSTYPSGPTIVGTLASILRPLIGASILGRLGSNFGLLGTSDVGGATLGLTTLLGSGSNPHNNYGYVNVYVY